jgi:hypothetical protein
VLVTVVLVLALFGCSRRVADPRPLAMPSPTTAGRSLYVAVHGDDDNPGTRAKPLRTISKATRMARPGMTVIVAPGTYAESITSQTSGTRNARIVFTSETLWGAQIIGVGTRSDAAWRNDGDYVDIMNFDISGNEANGLQDGGSHVHLRGNRVHNVVHGNCVMTWDANYTLHDIEITENVVANCGTTMLDHGIYAAYSRGLIANNIAYGNAGFGIHCWHNCGQLTISNNLTFQNGGGIVIGQGDSPNFGHASADDMTVSNNIAVANRTVGITEGGVTGSRNRYLNNILFDNGEDQISLKTGTQTGTIISDPEFVDYQPDGSGDYRLRDGSPGIDAGTSVGAPPCAIDATPRARGHGYDIGVYER